MCKSVLESTKRDPKIETRRNNLTCQLKNMVLFHLMNFKLSKQKPSFKEVIAQVIRKKKEDMKKQRKKKLAMLMGENVDDEDEDKIEGLNKD